MAAEIEALSLGVDCAESEDVTNGQLEGGLAQQAKKQKVGFVTES